MSSPEAEETPADAEATPADAEETSVEARHREFGSPGVPFERHSPFYIGFFGGLGALLAFWLGSQLLAISSVLILIVVALFLAAGLNPIVEYLTGRGLKRPWAVLVVIIGVLLALGLFVLAIVPVISEQVAALTRSAPGWLDELQRNNQVRELDAKYDIIDRIRDYIAKGDYANHVVELRKRYWLLSVPLQLWTCE